MSSKVCKKCGAEKPLCEFHKNAHSKDGLRPRCKPCHIQDSAEWALKTHDRVIAKLRAWYDANKRKPRVLLTKEEKAAKKLAYARRTADKQREAKKKWADANKHIQAESVRRRQAAKLKATVPWADKNAMQEFYRLARELTQATGIKHEVDHIVPLRGTNVCGLHWEGNLQILTKTN